MQMTIADDDCAIFQGVFTSNKLQIEYKNNGYRFVYQIAISLHLLTKIQPNQSYLYRVIFIYYK